MCTKNINFCALTETWIKDDDMLTPNRMCPKGYDSILIPRSDKAGGGLAGSIQERPKCASTEIRKNQHNGIPSCNFKRG